MNLTAVGLKNAKPTDKPYKLADSGGLHLLVNPRGSKLWFDYTPVPAFRVLLGGARDASSAVKAPWLSKAARLDSLGA